jgi:hypothetical protein
MFAILDDTNTAHVSMNNPYTGFNREVITSTEPKSISWAVMCFAKDQGINAYDVEVSIKYPETKLDL